MSSTHPRIILLVVATIALLALIYLATMSACVFLGLNPQANVLQAFGHAGDVLLGALIGLLVNTRTSAGVSNSVARSSLARQKEDAST